jgi:hypothetical protein
VRRSGAHTGVQCPVMQQSSRMVCLHPRVPPPRHRTLHRHPRPSYAQRQTFGGTLSKIQYILLLHNLQPWLLLALPCSVHTPLMFSCTFSMGYIHLVLIRPHKSSSYTKLYGRCVIMSKNDGGNSISNNAILSATST